MKKVITYAVVAAMVLGFGAPQAMAATESAGPFTATAVVASGLSLQVVLKKNSFSGATVGAMNYGSLIDIGTGTLRSSPSGSTGTGAIAAFVTANSQGLPYTVTQTGTTMSNGTTTLPDGALNVVPIYADGDNGGLTQPPGSAIGTKGTWVGTRTLYTSEPAGALRTIQCIYSVTDDPAAGSTAGVPLSQPAGTYTGTVTFTVTA